MNTKKIVIIAVILLLSVGTAAALSFNVLPAIRMHLAGTTLEESSVVVDDITPVGNKKLNSVSVTLNNTDTIDHTVVNVYASIENANEVEIGTGLLTAVVVSAGTISTVSISITEKPQMADVSQMIITVKEL